MCHAAPRDKEDCNKVMRKTWALQGGKGTHLTYCFSPNIGCFFFYVSHPATFREKKGEKEEKAELIVKRTCCRFMLSYLFVCQPCEIVPPHQDLLPQRFPSYHSSPSSFIQPHFHHLNSFKKPEVKSCTNRCVLCYLRAAEAKRGLGSGCFAGIHISLTPSWPRSPSYKLSSPTITPSLQTSPSPGTLHRRSKDRSQTTSSNWEPLHPGLSCSHSL